MGRSLYYSLLYPRLTITITDCFKYRSAIGLDVALEALKEAWTARKLDLNLFAKYAQTCRVPASPTLLGDAGTLTELYPVAEYLTVLPSKKLLQAKLQESIAPARR